MTKTRGIHSRVIIMIICVLAILLAVGSLLLRQIVFKAQSTSSALLISPQSVSVQPKSQFNTTIKTLLEKPTWISAAQFTLVYDSATIEVKQILPAAGWTTKKFANDGGVIRWAMLPSDDAGSLVELNGEQEFGTIQWTGSASGNLVLRFDPTSTIIAAVDPTNSPSLHNAISSFQDSVVSVSNAAASSSIAELAASATPTQISSDGTTQRIIALEPLPGTDAVAIILSLKYKAQVTIEFGKTNALGSSLHLQDQSSDFLAKIAGLDPKTQYFYRAIIENNQGTGRIISGIKTFTTGEASATNIVSPDKSEMKAVPTLAKQGSSLVAVFRDQAGAVVTIPDAAFSSVKGVVTISKPNQFGGLITAAVSNGLSSRQTAQVRLTGSGETIAEDSVMFDPNLVGAVEPQETSASTLPWSRTVGTIVVVLIAALLLSGICLLKLARAK